MSPEFIDAAVDLYGYPLERQVLGARREALVLLALEVICTAPRADAATAMAERAIRAGASAAEVLTTVELASVLGLHSLSWGIPRLRSALVEAGSDLPHTDDLEDRTFRGQPLDDTTAAIAAADPELFDRMSRSVAVAWNRGALGSVECHLICLAIDASASHQYAPGFDLHARAALRDGATPAEIAAVLQLCALTGLRGLHVGLDAYESALEAIGQTPTTHQQGDQT